MRRIDITDRLSFDEQAVLVIKGEELEVNQDAPTVLKVMALMDDGSGLEEVMKAYELILPKQSRDKVEALKLNFNDLMTVVKEAFALVTGLGEEPREDHPVL